MTDLCILLKPQSELGYLGFNPKSLPRRLDADSGVASPTI